MTSIEILETLNDVYIKIEKIAQSQEWRELCEAKRNDPEMKTNLGDVLHYLGEAINDVEEASQ